LHSHTGGNISGSAGRAMNTTALATTQLQNTVAISCAMIAHERSVKSQDDLTSNS
jgi:hypothetical protein